MPVALGSQGTFVANNNVVSQSVAHLHVHVVPRTKGDGLKGFFWPRRADTRTAKPPPRRPFCGLNCKCNHEGTCKKGLRAVS